MRAKAALWNSDSLAVSALRKLPRCFRFLQIRFCANGEQPRLGFIVNSASRRGLPIDMTQEEWKQIDELLQAALNEAPGDLAAFLDRVCAGNEVMRREVESLL